MDLNLRNAALKTILRIYAYEKTLSKIYPELNECCGLEHTNVPFAVSNRIKCPSCTKYFPYKTFTTHLQKCIKKRKDEK